VLAPMDIFECIKFYRRIIKMSENIHDVTPGIDENLDGEDKFYEEVSLTDLGKLLESNAEGTTKPIFESNTPATIVSVTVKRSKKKETTRTGDSYYLPLIVSIETRTDDGQISYDNYGGLRQTEEGTLWCGEKSQFGKLIQLIKQEDSNVRTFNDIFNFLNKEGLRVKIKTQTTTFNDTEYKKNLITQII